MYKIKEKKIKKCGLNIYLVTLVDVDNNLGRMTNNKNHNYTGEQSDHCVIPSRNIC